MHPAASLSQEGEEEGERGKREGEEEEKEGKDRRCSIHEDISPGHLERGLNKLQEGRRRRRDSPILQRSIQGSDDLELVHGTLLLRPLPPCFLGHDWIEDGRLGRSHRVVLRGMGVPQLASAALRASPAHQSNQEASVCQRKGFRMNGREER